MARSNCLFVALSLWFTRGGYIIARKSRHTWVPHFMWTKSIDGVYLIEYIPNDEKVTVKERSRVLRWFPIGVIFFKGRVRRKVGDA